MTRAHELSDGPVTCLLCLPRLCLKTSHSYKIHAATPVANHILNVCGHKMQLFKQMKYAPVLQTVLVCLTIRTFSQINGDTPNL